MEKEKNNSYAIPIAIVIAGAMLSGSWLYISQNPPNKISEEKNQKIATAQNVSVSALEEAVLPSVGVILPVSWGDLGAKLVSVGAIDEVRFKALYDERGQFPEEYKSLLVGNNADKLKITKDNAGYLLNLFWALGLASKNPVLDSGEMANPRYGGAGNFASTGGWTMAQGNPMDHYSRHKFFNLMPEQQALVEKISKGIYRPCCNNSTHFPDCNHGMAMLGLLELMASQGVSEQEMWQAALAVNSYWFPDTYLTIATYMKNKSVEWKDVKPEEILGVNYSSGSGYQKIASQVVITPSNSQGGGCDVSAGQSVSVPQQKQSGCGI
ncbi:MAG: hypothetical protein A3G03_01315 [Candidatus Taylorbacteria bacterium RIFCSPLOWO2_12_FULL_44_15c]|uniref:Uncharacterized protein n=1 Tax=Candidatus Taylorbacteria bacterium RIFCSPLOWO2_12_FULL_44_15c TaxID=1802333 RepID=A0A1G2P531_9BACT|nr:MAG: hypothetical protein A3I97_03100 [Candidatus Taylorbacteria bacterium RIFCSPLOWO2_02_FULL_44_35]OHA43436.1 MAG: hypothetical protein A3G03_01315 [Candidatus Taylorbacteria bacterium RIFCSPLOWO2_12_FULL_44_15c]